jgi:hypothetical protein
MPKSAGIPAFRKKDIRGISYAVVTMTDAATGKRKDFLLGKHGTRESKAEYGRIIHEWESRGRRLLEINPHDITINEIGRAGPVSKRDSSFGIAGAVEKKFGIIRHGLLQVGIIFDDCNASRECGLGDNVEENKSLIKVAGQTRKHLSSQCPAIEAIECVRRQFS